MPNILIPCPKCGSGLRLKDRTNLGKLGRCPKCANRFVLEEPEEVELELADASVPSTGTAAQWVPDSAGTSAQSSATAVAEGGSFNISTEPAAGTGINVSTHPTIEVGMTFAEVSKLLGKPSKRKRMSEMVAQAKKQGKKMAPVEDAAKREYLVFRHAAGMYKLIFRDDEVVEIHSQPTAESSPAAAPLVPSRSKRSQKNKMIGIALGGVLALGLVAVMIYASSIEEPPAVAEVPEKEKPKENKSLTAAKAALENNFEFSQRFTQENFPSKGEPISFAHIPHGANIIIHLRPAEIWSDEPRFAMLRASMTQDVLQWAEPVIKQHCLFEPKEIEEALICIMLQGRGEAPEIATRVKLAAPKKKSEFLTLFQGAPNNEYGYPIYDDGQRAYMVERDSQTFAVAPSRLAQEMVANRKPTLVSKQGIPDIAVHTDRERHLTVIFQPFDVRMHQDVLVSNDVKGVLNGFLNWLDVDDVETALWSMHLGPEKFYSKFLVRQNHQWTPRQLEKELQDKLHNYPGELYARVQSMNPQKMGFRKVIGRFPAMMKVASLQTLGATGEGMAQFTTVLPAKAASNLALGSMLTWYESLNPASVAPTTPTTSEPKLPDLIVDRFKTPMDADFNRRPLQDAFDDIGEAATVKFEIDGDALKFAGYTKNMAQSFKLGEVPISQVLAKILSQYDKMCICITDEEKNIVTVMTFEFAKQKGLTPLKFQ